MTIPMRSANQATRANLFLRSGELRSFRLGTRRLVSSQLDQRGNGQTDGPVRRGCLEPVDMNASNPLHLHRMADRQGAFVEVAAVW